MHDDESLPDEATKPGPDMTSAEQLPDPISLDPVIQAHIGRELRALFDAIADEPVPDRFLSLLQNLESKKQGNV
jgi:hypothetical protein